jgi:hypothetical protein
LNWDGFRGDQLRWPVEVARAERGTALVEEGIRVRRDVWVIVVLAREEGLVGWDRAG